MRNEEPKNSEELGVRSEEFRIALLCNAYNQMINSAKGANAVDCRLPTADFIQRTNDKRRNKR